MNKIIDKSEFEKIHEGLSLRQREVLQRVLVNESDTTIGKALGIKETSVRKHIERMAHSFGFKNAPGERRSRRSALLTLYGKYKPEAIAQNPLFRNPESEISNLTQRVDELEKQVSQSSYHDSVTQESGVSLLTKEEDQNNLQGNPIISDNIYPCWGNNPDIISFGGRVKEIEEIKKIIHDGTRLVEISGVSGIGKTYLASKVFQDLKKENKDRFQAFLWLTLEDQDYLDLSNLLDNLINHFQDQISNPYVKELLVYYKKFPDDVEGKILLLLKFLEEYSLLMVIDGFDILLQKGELAGEYQEKYSNYGKFIKRWGEQKHKSCLIITTKDKLKEISRLEPETSEEEEGIPVKSLELAGISLEEAIEIFKGKAYKMAKNTEEKWTELIDGYEGNPLALKMAIDFIQEVCNGSINEFLALDTLVFGDIENLVIQVYERLSEKEKYIVQFLGKKECYNSIIDLMNDLLKTEENSLKSKPEIMKTMQSLKRRGLIQTRDRPNQFRLQSIIKEFVNGKFMN